MWQWWNDVTWVFYDVPSCHILEKAFQSNQAIVYLSISSVNLFVAVDMSDKTLMIQVNQETRFKREVQRIICPPYPPSYVPSNIAKMQSHGNIRSQLNHSVNTKTSTAKSIGIGSYMRTKKN